MQILLSSAIACGYDLATALQRTREVGASEIDLLAVAGFAHIDPSTLADHWSETMPPVDRSLKQHGQTVRSMNCGFSAPFQDRSEAARATRRKETLAVIRAMRHFGLSVVCFESTLHGDGSPWSTEDQDRCMDSIAEILAIAAEEKVTLCLETHERTAFETPAQVERLLQRFPDIPLAYDPTHFVAQGIDLRESRHLIRNAVICHLRDAAPGKIQVPFGDGSIDFDWILAALREEAYQGPLVIEYLGFDDDADFVVDSSQQLYRYLQQRAG